MFFYVEKVCCGESLLVPPISLSESLLCTEHLPATPCTYFSTSLAYVSPLCRTGPGSTTELPTFSLDKVPTFTWGSCDSVTFINSLNAAYNEVVHWRPNLFKVPLGKAGKSFVCELARMYMYKAFTSSSAMESIAMKAAVTLPILLGIYMI